MYNVGYLSYSAGHDGSAEYCTVPECVRSIFSLNFFFEVSHFNWPDVGCPPMQEILGNLENDYPSKTPLHSSLPVRHVTRRWHFYFFPFPPILFLFFRFRLSYGTNILSTVLECVGAVGE